MDIFVLDRPRLEDHNFRICIEVEPQRQKWQMKWLQQMFPIHQGVKARKMVHKLFH